MLEFFSASSLFLSFSSPLVITSENIVPWNGSNQTRKCSGIVKSTRSHIWLKQSNFEEFFKKICTKHISLTSLRLTRRLILYTILYNQYFSKKKMSALKEVNIVFSSSFYLTFKFCCKWAKIYIYYPYSIIFRTKQAFSEIKIYTFLFFYLISKI